MLLQPFRPVRGGNTSGASGFLLRYFGFDRLLCEPRFEVFEAEAVFHAHIAHLRAAQGGEVRVENCLRLEDFEPWLAQQTIETEIPQ